MYVCICYVFCEIGYFIKFTGDFVNKPKIRFYKFTANSDYLQNDFLLINVNDMLF